MPLKDPDAQREFQRAWMRSRRMSWIEEQGGKCNNCGSTERLEVDHIDPKTKSCNPAAIWSGTEERRRAELAKCQVLCYACHREKTSSERRETAKPCGTAAAYARGCRCDSCREANRVRVRIQRANQTLRSSEDRAADF